MSSLPLRIVVADTRESLTICIQNAHSAISVKFHAFDALSCTTVANIGAETPTVISPANKLYQARFEADLQFAEPKAHAEQSNVHNLNQPVVVHITHAPGATTLLSHFSSALQGSASV